jgi:hypothetical protein
MRPALRALGTGQVINHSDINALRRWGLDAYDIAGLIIKPNSTDPGTKIDIKIGMAALHSMGGELVIKGAVNTPAISLTLDTAETGVSGLDTGKLGSGSLYAIYLAAKAESENGLAGQIGVIASSNWQGPALPAGWTHKRLIGAFRSYQPENGAEPEIQGFVQVGAWYRYHSRQEVIAVGKLEADVPRTVLELSAFVPPVSEVALVLGRVMGSTAPQSLKIFEHNTGEEVMTLAPKTEDFAQEAREVSCPGQKVDYAISRTTTAAGFIISLLGFHVPIAQEF